jgi:shikimate kinase
MEAIQKPIFLVGYMGSGKTTFGKKLANKLGRTFVDLDKLIESNEGKTIPQIFADKGEADFRELEKQTLLVTINMKNVVIATGGGTPCFFDNMETMNSSGITLYLKLSVAGLFNRLKNAKTERPLIKNLTEEELKAFIALNLAKREPFYIQAKHIIAGENIYPEDVLLFLA